MRKQNSSIAVAFLCTVISPIVAGCNVQPGDAQAASLPIWEPDTKMLDEMQPATPIDDYEVRAPKGYSLQPAPPNMPPAAKGLAWTAANRANGTPPQFMVSVVSAPPEEAKNFTAEQRLDKRLDAVKASMANWTQSPPEGGRINGVTFVRAYWTATHVGIKREMHGFLYVAKEGSKFIYLSSQDAEPNNESARKLAETAALSFKKK